MTSTEKEKLFEEILEENKDRIFRLCYTSLTNKDEADDLFQEVLISVWENLENFRYEAKVSTWTYRITVNSAILFNKRFNKRINRFKNIESPEMENVLFYEDNFHKGLSEDLNMLHKSISELNSQDRIIIGLYLEELSYEEISNIVGISINYVGVKINRIKETLANMIGSITNERI